MLGIFGGDLKKNDPARSAPKKWVFSEAISKKMTPREAPKKIWVFSEAISKKMTPRGKKTRNFKDFKKNDPAQNF